MLQRLIETLQTLAAPADIQLERFQGSVVHAGEPAADFDDALLLVRDCQQLQLTPRQQDALTEVESALNVIRGLRHSHLWTGDAVRTSTEWEEVRQRAGEALTALDAPHARARQGNARKL